MDLLLHYFDLSDDRVKVRFYDSHSDLMQQFKDLNPNHIYQISMDDPNLNLKFYDCIVKKKEENKQHVLVDLVTCGVCTIHGTFKYGAEKSDWNSKKIVEECYILLHDSPAPQDDYQSVTGSEKFPYSYVGHSSLKLHT